MFVGVISFAMMLALFLLEDLFRFVADFIYFRSMISKTLFEHLTKIHIIFHNLLTDKPAST